LRTEKGTSLGEYYWKDTIPFVYITSYCDKTVDRVKDTRPYGLIVKPFSDFTYNGIPRSKHIQT
jgi:hypothetical protein